MDSFAEFIQSKGFLSMFPISTEQTRELIDDKDKLLQFAMRFLKQVLFGENTIPMHENAQQQRIAERKEIWSKRKEEAATQWRENQEDNKYLDD